MLLSPLRHITPLGSRGSSAFSIANSFYLDGVSEYFTLTNAFTCLKDSPNEFSISMFIKKNDNNDAYVFSCSDNLNIRFRIDAGRNFIFYTNNSSAAVKYSYTNLYDFPLNQWVHVVVTYRYDRAKKMYFYFDGVEYIGNVETLDGTIQNYVSNTYHIGRASIYTNGYVNQLSIFDKTLTYAEVTSLYNNGKPKNPQQSFGTNCVYFFNPDNSGDTAQFSVVDSVNSITATSVNMEDADKTPLTAYSDSLQTIIDRYNTLNAWSFEKFGINGTTSTIYDYEGTHNLSNPAVANQPTFLGGDANINNRPSGYFVTDDYLYKATANYLSGQSTGAIHLAFTTNADVTTSSFIFGSGVTGVSSYITILVSGGKIKFLLKNTTTKRYEVDCDTTTILANTSYVVSAYQNGTTLQILINGVAQSLTVTSSVGSSPETFWFPDVASRDNITIGSLIYSTTLYSNLDIALVQITSDSADATVLNNHNDIKTIYGI